MHNADSLTIVKSLMEEFAAGTGLAAKGKTRRRYLWTDAFAVCNFLEIYRQTKEEKYLAYALRLVDQVHQVLGRHRVDDARSGWISGLDESEGAKHPTMGGLRIGKTHPERNPGEPYDDAMEWDRDGQYYHYLTKWMHALHRAGKDTGNVDYDRYARELAAAAHRRFVFRTVEGRPEGMFWKMSIDLLRAMVPSMGQHDPLDGLITYYELSRTAAGDSHSYLSSEIEEMKLLCKNKDWTTNDLLGAGGLLWDACRVAGLMTEKVTIPWDLLQEILSSAHRSLEYSSFDKTLCLDAHRRLAFREFGLSIGLHAIKRLKELMEQFPLTFKRMAWLSTMVKKIILYYPLAQAVEEFWLRYSNRNASTWIEHRDINSVMLATSLAPESFLMI